MALTLRFQTTGKVPGQAGPVRMTGSNLTVGRADENDLVLPDPDRTISKRHCVLEERGGVVMVIDISSNGTFLNYAKAPLGRDPMPVNDGDILSVGPYELLIDLSEPAAPEAPPPRQSAPVGLPPEADLPPLGSDMPERDSIDDILGTPRGGATDALIPEDADEDLLGSATPQGHAQLLPQEGDGDLLGGGGHFPEDDILGPLSPPTETGPMAPSQATAEQYTPTAAKQMFIPDDFDEGLLGPSSSGGAPQQNEAPGGPFGGGSGPFVERSEEARTPPPEQPREASTRHPGTRMRDGEQGRREAPRTTMGEPLVRREGQAPRTEISRAEPPRQAEDRTPPTDRSPLPEDTGLDFFEGLGIDPSVVGDRPDAMRQMGLLTRLMIAGLRDILMTRASIRSEFRMNQTVLRAEGNNPLKFSVTEEQAVEMLLKPAARGYMKSDKAVSEALDDIRVHEVAMLTGMQAALKGLLARLDPGALVQKLEETGARGGFFKAKKAQYWEIYEKAYAEIAREAENDFQELFQNEFARAYQEQLEKLK
ncbi:MAG: type VI secretion system-associated FHA domain protein TagH [Pseudomonadota bacterium]